MQGKEISFFEIREKVSTFQDLYPVYIQTNDQLTLFHARIIDEIGEVNEYNSRYSELAVIQMHCINERISPFIEAVVPLGNSDVLVYIGYNHDSRRSKNFSKYVKLLEEAMHVQQQPPEYFYKRLEDNAISIEAMSQKFLSEGEYLELQNLYEVFFDSPDTIKQLLSHPHIQLFVARNGERIVGAVCGIITNVFGNHIGEISWLAVDPEYSGMGIAGGLSQKALDYLESRTFGVVRELNASYPVVVRNARAQGCRFAFEFGREIGISSIGILEQDEKIYHGDNEPKEWNDFVVAYH